MKTVTLAISGMSCGHCVANVRNALAALPGAEVGSVRVGSAEVRLEDDARTGTDAVLAAVRDAGYDATIRTAGDGAPPTSGCCAPSAEAPSEIAVARRG